MNIRAHLAPFLHDSDCGHLLLCKLPCPHIRKNAICNHSSRFVQTSAPGIFYVRRAGFGGDKKISTPLALASGVRKFDG